jgi:hypothetical protein
MDVVNTETLCATSLRSKLEEASMRFIELTMNQHTAPTRMNSPLKTYNIEQTSNRSRINNSKHVITPEIVQTKTNKNKNKQEKDMPESNTISKPSEIERKKIRGEFTKACWG